jgi:hypothetical protein
MRTNFFKNVISGIFGDHKKNISDNNNTETTASLSGRSVTQSDKPISQDNQQTNSFEIPKQLTLKQRVIKSFKGILKFFFNRFQKDNLETNINSYNGAVTKNDNQQAKVIEELKEKLVGIKTVKEQPTSSTLSKENANNTIYDKLRFNPEESSREHVYKEPRTSDEKNTDKNVYDKLRFNPGESSREHVYKEPRSSDENNVDENVYEEPICIHKNSDRNHTYKNVDNLKEKFENPNGYQVPKSTPKPKTQ